MSRFLGKSLGTVVDYATWLPKRRIFDPCFKHNYLKKLIPAFNESADTFVQKLQALADGSTTVPLDEYLGEVSQDVISKVTFGSDFNQMYNDKSLGLDSAKSSGRLSYLISNTFKGLNVCLRTPSTTLYQWLHPYMKQRAIDRQ